MKKIVHLKAPGTLNIGNEFINIGAKYVIQRILRDLGISVYQLYEIEFWQTALPIGRKQTINWNTPETIEWLNVVDMIFVSGGSILNAYMKNILDSINALKPPKIMLGVGTYHYNEEERTLAGKVFSNYSLVWCRDKETYEAMRTTKKLNALDMAFFLKDSYLPPLARGEYGVVNMDVTWRNKMRIGKKRKELEKRFPNVYLTENTSTLHTEKDFVFLGSWTEFCNMYANAAFVSTTRIHTAIACTIFKTPFEYMRKDSGKTAQRNKLFENVGMDVSYGSVFSKEQLEDMQDAIKRRKEATIQEVVDIVKDLK
ncbi:MAG: hypothetical protein A3E07_00415 [Candidatus Wildermuthbacteria bacterium RIFCSPHIGHO2_12_FULL_45_9]|uniref:Polysaccharide pyruvyl transferase domain-containing protein n=1 Tax=Candidatus Wildermuthbacteria bacterium RIFCSPHIGHO2_02_FULL_45_25 TaxID=1802450 RepID=A0A1G2R2D2_9BACT|nr:MAG: hypothetical protein A3C04_03665 [Candidatus Wildermuthbacteria bacterium RIFCSPHIGHO2_02_FULL_45_25]OHA71366.1 MAG: hypothetical protein A3E07_00415 [Candidatus Wildermuthbacteria bacterium RIFCSPHIGHO2_12_FULL_45_9]